MRISGGTASVLSRIGSGKVREEATDIAPFSQGYAGKQDFTGGIDIGRLPGESALFACSKSSAKE
jgi:hypothetical protein